MARQVDVVITGDSTPVEKAFDRAARAAETFNRRTSKVSVGDQFEPLRQDVRRLGEEADRTSNRWKQMQANIGRRGTMLLRVGAGALAFTEGLEAAAVASNAVFGEQSQLSQGLNDASKGISSLIRLDFAGFFQATQGPTNRAREALEKYNEGLDDANRGGQALKIALAAEAAGFGDAANAIRDHVALLKAAQAGTEALDFAQRDFNQTIIDGTAYLVEYKGAHDAAMNPTGQPRVYGAGATPQALRSTGFLSPSQRRELELVGAEGTTRLPGLRDRAAELRGQLADFHGSQEQRYRLATRLSQTEKEIADVIRDQAAAEKAAKETADERAKAAAEEAARRRKDAREAAAAAEQRRQFRLIGLSPTGDAITPTVANLRRQAEQIGARLDAGEPLSAALRRRLPTVTRALTGGIKSMTEETRQAIAEFFRAIRDEWKKGDETLKPFATAGLNVNRTLAGLGLTGAQSRRLRARLSGLTASGMQLAGGGATAYGMALGSQPIQTTVYLDGQVVGRSTKRYLSSDSVRSPMQKRGPHAGRG